jgi:hypothetical protein
MKKVWIVLLSVLLVSCVSERKVMDSWIGSNQHALVMQLGPPDRTASDGDGGEILIYSTQQYNSYTGQVIYHCRMFFANRGGIIYHWMTKGSVVPPQQMNIDLYIH